MGETGLIERLLELFLAVAVAMTSLVGSIGQSVMEPNKALTPLESAQAVMNDCSQLQLFGEPLVTPDLGDVRCGTVAVPENWDEPAGRTIQISFVVLLSTSAEPKPDPILYLEGGPGGSALTGLAGYATEIFDEMREDRDIILFDQRGTRYSSPLKCSLFTVDELFAESSFIESEGGVPEIELVPPADAEEMLKKARLDVGEDTRRCVHEITANGVDLRQYNSAASGTDAVALLNALGYRVFNLYGISYGTRLALVIMRDHPNSGIRSTVLDSSFPPEIPGFERFTTEAHEVVMQLFSDCRLDPACNDAYPRLKERFVALLDRLEIEPLIASDGTTVTALDLVTVVTSISGYTESAAFIPKMIAELESGSATTYNAIVTGEILGVEFPDSGEIEEVFDEALGGGPGEAEAPLAPDASEEDRAQEFILDIQARATQLPVEARDNVLYLLTSLDKVPRTRSSLEAFVEMSFAADDQSANQDALLETVSNLTDQEIRRVYDLMEGSFDIIDLFTIGLSQPVFNSVECNEEIPFERFENSVANAISLEIPELAYGSLEFIATQFATCEIWPSGRARDIESRPVVSDVPTLVFAGSYDFQTPISWNRQAFVNLTNSYYVEFPATGHGVIAGSQCAKDVAEEFINTPFKQPNSACTSDLWPIWAMPD